MRVKLYREILIVVLVPDNMQECIQKIGMHHNEVDDFDHPKLSEGHPLKRHVLYRLKSNEWRETICKT